MRRLLLAMDLLLVATLVAAVLHAVGGRRAAVAECTAYVKSRGLSPEGICTRRESGRAIPRYEAAMHQVRTARAEIAEGRLDDAREELRAALDTAVELDRGPSTLGRLAAESIFRNALDTTAGKALPGIVAGRSLRGVTELLEVDRLRILTIRNDLGVLDNLEMQLLDTPWLEPRSRASDERLVAVLGTPGTCEAIGTSGAYGMPPFLCEHLRQYRETELRVRAAQ